MSRSVSLAVSRITGISGYVFLDLPEQLKPTAIRQIDIQQDQGYTAAKQLFSSPLLGLGRI